jgi:glyceraldehyde-3-phosphate dehydrogenase/erythrose-4-phosphate dehydrogenase
VHQDANEIHSASCKLTGMAFRVPTSVVSVVDTKAGIALDDTFIKLVSWYDNKWGTLQQGRGDGCVFYDGCPIAAIRCP